jgi:hypothetical protein
MAAQEWQSILAWDPMNDNAIALMAATQGEADPQAAPLETVASSLGYTNNEMSLAGQVLDRFVWQQKR